MAVLRVFWAMVLALAAALCPAAWAQSQAEDNPSVYVENTAGSTIMMLWASLSTSTGWGEDRLGRETLPSGQRFALVLPRGACEYDLRAEYANGRVEEKRNLNLCRVSSVTFDGSGSRPGGEGGGSAGAGPRGNPSFWLVNGAPKVLLVFYAWRADSSDRGPDRLGDEVVGVGGRFAVSLPEGPCAYHLRAEYEDGGVEERRNVNLCDVTELRFDGGGGQARREGRPAQTGDPSIALVNRTGQVIVEAYASLTSDSDWGDDRLGQSVLRAGQRFVLALPNGDCLWDLRMVYDNDRAEEKRDLNLCQVSEVVFDGSAAVALERNQGPTAPAPPSAERGASYGTGFFISAQGHMLTNHHVIDGCRNVRVLLEDGPAPATVLRHNERNDLALLRVQRPPGQPYARFRAQPSIRPGDSVVVAGFPLPNVLQNGLNITTGNVSAMAGLGGDIALMQITAPVQPGNSGGPLLDLSGHVVGVIVSKLNAQRIAAQTGDIPQNINFAVQGAVTRLFLESGGTRYTEAPSTTEMRAADVGERARDFTFQIECR